MLHHGLTISGVGSVIVLRVEAVEYEDDSHCQWPGILG
jgi:hypothetical protein